MVAARDAATNKSRGCTGTLRSSDPRRLPAPCPPVASVRPEGAHHGGCSRARRGPAAAVELASRHTHQRTATALPADLTDRRLRGAVGAAKPLRRHRWWAGRSPPPAPPARPISASTGRSPDACSGGGWVPAGAHSRSPATKCVSRSRSSRSAWPGICFLAASPMGRMRSWRRSGRCIRPSRYRTRATRTSPG